MLSFADFFLYFYESKWVNELKKNVLIKARKLCNIFRLIDDLNSINVGGEYEIKCCIICLEKSEPRKGNTDK